MVQAHGGVRYPDVTVQLSGQDGNAYAIIGSVGQAIRRAHGQQAADDWARRAMDSASYDALLVAAMSEVHVL